MELLVELPGLENSVLHSCKQKTGREKKGVLCFLATMFSVLCCNSGMACGGDDHLCPTQEEPMTPESTSSVLPLRTNTAGAQSRLPHVSPARSAYSAPKHSTRHAAKKAGGNCDRVAYTCKIW